MVSETPTKRVEDWWGQFTPTLFFSGKCGVGPHQRFGNAELMDGSHPNAWEMIGFVLFIGKFQPKCLGFLELVEVELTHGFFGSHKNKWSSIQIW